MPREILNEAYLEAEEIIKDCLHPLGIRASAKIKTKLPLMAPIRRAALFLLRASLTLSLRTFLMAERIIGMACIVS